MVDLDDVVVYRKLDVSDMLGQLYGLPQQCQGAWNKAVAFKLPEDYKDIDKVVVLGMGGSAIGGDLLRNLISNQKKPMVFVNRNYDLPPFVDGRTLVIGSSYSGNTEETLTTFSHAMKTDCKKMVSTTGGRLKEMAQASNIPVFPIEHVSPPRAALGYSFMPLIGFLTNLGLIEPSKYNVEKMVALLKKLLNDYQETRPERENPAKQLARKLHGRIAVIYGAGIATDSAYRWKTQINENAKAWAFSETIPELNHNSLVGYQYPAELASKILVFFLRAHGMNERVLLRYNITMEILQARNIEYEVVEASGEDDLSLMMSLIYLGDWISYYLAILYGIDPSPVKVIDHLKGRLGDTQGLLL